MASNPFSQMLPILNGENYQMWAIKMKAHFKALSLWEVVEREADPTPLVQNPTLAQIKKYEGDLGIRQKIADSKRRQQTWYKKKFCFEIKW